MEDEQQAFTVGLFIPILIAIIFVLGFSSGYLVGLGEGEKMQQLLQ
jgi:hypothetical protein